jgi:hypothetical protein
MTQRRKFLAATLGILGLAKVPAKAAEGDGNPAGGPDILFVHRDLVVDFNPGTGLGTHLGTADGRITGTTIVNFQFTPVSQTDITFDNRVLITDLEGDQVLFKQTGAGRFITPLSEKSINGNLMGTGGPLAGVYECVQASGKWSFLVGRKFSHRTIATNPSKALPGCVYVEVYNDRFDAKPV